MSSLIELMQSKRIALTPEYDGGWHADIYEDEDEPIYRGYGETITAAVYAALQVEVVYKIKQGESK